MAEVIRLLRQEHANMAKLLDLVEREAGRCGASGGPDYETIRGVLDYCLSYPAICHHPKENLVFARLRRRDAAAAETMGDLLAEHEALESRTRALLAAVHRALQGAPPPRAHFEAAAGDFLAFYRRHMEVEEQCLFPQAQRALSAADWAEIDAQVTAADDPLFGERLARGFDALRAELLGEGETGGGD